MNRIEGVQVKSFTVEIPEAEARVYELCAAAGEQTVEELLSACLAYMAAMMRDAIEGGGEAVRALDGAKEAMANIQSLPKAQRERALGVLDGKVSILPKRKT